MEAGLRLDGCWIEVGSKYFYLIVSFAVSPLPVNACLNFSICRIPTLDSELGNVTDMTDISV